MTDVDLDADAVDHARRALRAYRATTATSDLDGAQRAFADLIDAALIARDTTTEWALREARVFLTLEPPQPQRVEQLLEQIIRRNAPR